MLPRGPLAILRTPALACALALGPVAVPATAQELLTNPSFETPVAPAAGNNFYASIAGWTIVAAGSPAQPVNLIRPNASYTGGPTAPPTGGGLQYFDVNSTSGVLTQVLTVTTSGTVDWGGWFSVRDNPQTISGCVVSVKNSSGTVIATANTSFASTDSLQLWKRVGATGLRLAPGTYTFEVQIPDPINFDLATFFFRPDPTVAKSAAVVQDPSNGTTNPKAIPGAFVTYALKVSNPGAQTLDAGTQALADATPANVSLVVSGAYAPAFTASTSALTLTYSGPTSAADNVEFSKDSGATWTYSPAPDARGVDAAVTNVRFRPQGTMAAASDYTVRVTYAVK